MQIASLGGTLHEISDSVLWEKLEKYFKVLSAAIYVSTGQRLTLTL